jgi:uncharacterized damage-inducible protein DinB
MLPVMAGSTGTSGLNIVPVWGRLNTDLMGLLHAIPDDRLDWSPRGDLWSFRRLFVHLAAAREEWMTRAIDDGVPNVVDGRDHETQPVDKPHIEEMLRRTWERIEPVFADQSRLDATYRDKWWDKAPLYDGHWVAFHLLEHDIHHRADMLLYMGLLGLDVPQVWTA